MSKQTCYNIYLLKMDESSGLTLIALNNTLALYNRAVLLIGAEKSHMFFVKATNIPSQAIANLFAPNRLGTLKPERFVLTMNHVRQIYDPSTLPKNFDAEQKWPQYISPIQDQGWCGSSWAISTAAVASDRCDFLGSLYDLR